MTQSATTLITQQQQEPDLFVSLLNMIGYEPDNVVVRVAPDGPSGRVITCSLSSIRKKDQLNRTKQITHHSKVEKNTALPAVVPVSESKPSLSSSLIHNMPTSSTLSRESSTPTSSRSRKLRQYMKSVVLHCDELIGKILVDKSERSTELTCTVFAPTFRQYISELSKVLLHRKLCQPLLLMHSASQSQPSTSASINVDTSATQRATHTPPPVHHTAPHYTDAKTSLVEATRYSDAQRWLLRQLLRRWLSMLYVAKQLLSLPPTPSSSNLYKKSTALRLHRHVVAGIIKAVRQRASRYRHILALLRQKKNNSRRNSITPKIAASSRRTGGASTSKKTRRHQQINHLERVRCTLFHALLEDIRKEMASIHCGLTSLQTTARQFCTSSSTSAIMLRELEMMSQRARHDDDTSTDVLSPPSSTTTLSSYSPLQTPPREQVDEESCEWDPEEVTEWLNVEGRGSSAPPPPLTPSPHYAAPSINSGVSSGDVPILVGGSFSKENASRFAFLIRSLADRTHEAAELWSSRAVVAPNAILASTSSDKSAVNVVDAQVPIDFLRQFLPQKLQRSITMSTPVSSAPRGPLSSPAPLTTIYQQQPWLPSLLTNGSGQLDLTKDGDKSVSDANVMPLFAFDAYQQLPPPMEQLGHLPDRHMMRVGGGDSGIHNHHNNKAKERATTTVVDVMEIIREAVHAANALPPRPANTDRLPSQKVVENKTDVTPTQQTLESGERSDSQLPTSSATEAAADAAVQPASLSMSLRDYAEVAAVWRFHHGLLSSGVLCELMEPSPRVCITQHSSSSSTAPPSPPLENSAMMLQRRITEARALSDQCQALDLLNKWCTKKRSTIDVPCSHRDASDVLLRGILQEGITAGAELDGGTTAAEEEVRVAWNRNLRVRHRRVARLGRIETLMMNPTMREGSCRRFLRIALR